MALEKVAYNYLLVKEVVDLYERLYPTGPDSIYECMREAKAEQAELTLMGVAGKHGIINKNEAGRRQKYTMPSHLYIMLQKKFPTIFRADLKNFERDFPVFFKAWR